MCYFIKNKTKQSTQKGTLISVAPLVEASPYTPGGGGSIPGQEHTQVVGSVAFEGGYKRQPINVFLPLLCLPLPNQ